MVKNKRSERSFLRRKRVLTVTMTDDEMEDLEALAYSSYLSKAQLVRMLIRQAVAK